MSTILLLALAACGLAWPPVEVARDPVTIDQVPAPARATLGEQAKGRPLRDLARVEHSDGSVAYEGRFKKPLRYGYDVSVAADGQLLGRWRDAISGDGP